MATKLFLRSSQGNSIGATYFDMLTTAGAGSTTAVVDTDGSTEKQWTQTSGGALIQWVSGRAPAGGFTLTTSDISIWAHESATAANSGGRYRLFKRTSGGTETELAGGPFDDGVEFTKTTPTEMTWTGNPTDTAFSENDRILLKLYITNVGSMGSGQTCTLTYNAADAATGDSFLNIAETVTFKAEATEVAADAGSLTLTKYNAAINSETAFTADAGALTLTPQNASLNVETAFTASAGSLALTSFGATVTGTAPPTEVNANAASLTLTAQNATVKTDTAFTASAGSLALTTFAAGIKTNTTFTASAGSLALSAFAATVKENVSFTSGTSALALTAFSAGVKTDTAFSASTGSLSLTGFPATVTLGSPAVNVDVLAGYVPLSLVAHAASVSLTLRQSHPKEFVVMEARRKRVRPSIF